MNNGYSTANVFDRHSAAMMVGLRAGANVRGPFLAFLCGFYWLFPALWALGLAPFAPFVFVAIGGFTALLVNRRIRFSSYELLGIGLLLAGASVGLLSIGRPDRILTWCHDVAVIVSMMLIVNAVRRVRNPNRIRQIDKALLIFIGFVVIVGITGLVVPGHIRYNTPVMDLLPKSLNGTDYAKSLFRVDLYTHGWFAHTTWRRIKGVSMFATSLAAMLSVWIVYMAGKDKRTRVEWAVIFGAALVLLATLDRTSAVAAIGGIGIICFLRSGTRGKAFIATVGIAAAALGCLVAFTDVTVYVHKFLVLRGGGSFHGRLQIYSETWQAIKLNPWGHGTEHHVPGLGPPLGSHSTWLGLLYKFGVLGLFGFVIYGVGVICQLCRGVTDIRGRRLAAGLGLFAAIALISILEELYVDSTTAIVMATVVGIVLRPLVSVQISPSRTS